MVTRIVVLLIVAAALSYLGAGGWARLDLARAEESLMRKSRESGTPIMYKRLQFENKDQLSQFMMQEAGTAVFPWILVIPDALAAVFIGLCFGGLGGVGSVVARSFLKSEPLRRMPLAGMILFGSLIGLLFTFVSFITPDWLTRLTPEEGRSGALAGLCFLGGVFPLVAYQSVEQYFKGVLPPAKPGDGRAGGRGQDDEAGAAPSGAGEKKKLGDAA
ncbi:MAG: hypothetical protein JNG88_00765 [Phycisphaerales bacterium]|nr:hypothetical protein [Phycisphaerales bacterium]